MSKIEEEIDELVAAAKRNGFRAGQEDMRLEAVITIRTKTLLRADLAKLIADLIQSLPIKDTSND